MNPPMEKGEKGIEGEDGYPPVSEGIDAMQLHC